MIIDILFLGSNAVEIDDIAGKDRPFPLNRRIDIAIGIDPGEMIPDSHLRIAAEHPAEIPRAAQQDFGIHSQQSFIIDHGFSTQQINIKTVIADQFDPLIGSPLLDRLFRHAAGHQQCCGARADYYFCNLHGIPPCNSYQVVSLAISI